MMKKFLAITALVAALVTPAHTEVPDQSTREIELDFDEIVAIEAFNKDCKTLDTRIILAVERWILILSANDQTLSQYHAAQARLVASRRGKTKEAFCTAVEVLYRPLDIKGMLRRIPTGPTPPAIQPEGPRR
jgi:hypothetical protein